MTGFKDEPWQPADATQAINTIARSMELNLAYKKHAFEREDLREIIIGDVKHVLKYGFVYDDPVPATREGCFRYRIVGPSPNTRRRELAVIVIPHTASYGLKIVSIMWNDK